MPSIENGTMLEREHSRTPLALALLASFFLAAPAAALQKSGGKDTVQLKDGKTESGKIEEEDWTGIVIKGIDPIPWENVVSVDYTGESEYDAALRADQPSVGKVRPAQLG